MSNTMKKIKLLITDELIELSVALLNSHDFSSWYIFYALKYLKIFSNTAGLQTLILRVSTSRNASQTE